jgi:hypothetical protein
MAADFDHLPGERELRRKVAGRTLGNLAVPGYTCSDVPWREAPKVPSGATVVILNCGTNASVVRLLHRADSGRGTVASNP